MPRLLVLAFLLPALAAAQPPAAPAARADGAPAAARSDSTRRNGRQRPAPRRQTVTAELEQSAFADPLARSMLLRARSARLSQDSALRAYDAKTYQRLTVGIGVRMLGRDRTLLRQESAAHVRWSRDNGVWVEPTGNRAVMPAMKEANVNVDADDIAPIPYFPGRETLWFPSGDMSLAKTEVNERDMLHPLATGAEAYYRYATGDSVSIQLPDGRSIALRELRVTARRPQWRAFVGSFWFDVERGSLVRAGYRMASDMDIWKVATEENRAQLEDALARVQSDTSAAARAAVASARREMKDDAPPAFLKAMLHPMRANISAITVEYGLYEGRFWLPKANVAEGEAQAGMMRMPVRFEERFRYNAVNGTQPIPKLPTPTELGLSAEDSVSEASGSIIIGDNGRHSRDTSVAGRRQFDDSLSRRYAFRADSLRSAAQAATAKGDTAAARRLSARARRNELAGRQLVRKRERVCARQHVRRGHAHALRRDAARGGPPAVRRALAGDVAGPAAVDLRARRRLLRRLRARRAALGARQARAAGGLGAAGADRAHGRRSRALQPRRGPVGRRRGGGRVGHGLLGARAAPARDVGPGAQRRADADAQQRDAHAAGGPLPPARRRERRLGATRSRSARRSPSLLYGRDEGFYYRTFGAEVRGTRSTFLGGTPIAWRLFGERQRNAAQELRRAPTGARFIPNITAAQATLLGAGAEAARTLGQDPSGWRLYARGRGEGAYVDWSGDAAGRTAGFGRALLDATLSRGLGPLAASLTAAGGAIAGDAPPQRLFYLGGLQTVRGQFARPDTTGYVGDAMWMTRAELGLDVVSARPVVFYDMGWAGPRADFAHPGRPLSGYGVGLSFLDGLIRADLSRGIHPQQRTRFDLSVEARF